MRSEISNQYYEKNKYSDDKTVSLHLRLPIDIANDFTKIIAIYREYGMDKRLLTKSELGAIIIKEFNDNFTDDDSAILNLMGKVKSFRDGGATNE